MAGLNWVEMLIVVLFVAVCAMTGALILMQRMANITKDEARYDLPPGNTSLVAAVAGGLAGLGIAILAIYYYLLVGKPPGWIEWVGRASYALILAASAAHLMVLIHLWVRLNAEFRDLSRSGRGPQKATLLVRRRAALQDLRHATESYADLKTRDDEIVDELIGVLGERLLLSQRALSRIPFYGYLGTVCGILLMAQELSRLNEATETFKVLRDMSSGLALAFQTTLVALLTYLPLRKCFDILLSRMSALERAWLNLRDDSSSRRNNP